MTDPPKGGRESRDPRTPGEPWSGAQRKPTVPATPPPISTYAILSPGTRWAAPGVGERSTLADETASASCALDVLGAGVGLHDQLAGGVLDADLDLHGGLLRCHGVCGDGISGA